jgi:hypothetical protein
MEEQPWRQLEDHPGIMQQQQHQQQYVSSRVSISESRGSTAPGGIHNVVHQVLKQRLSSTPGEIL